jgi:hypothetical protein
VSAKGLQKYLEHANISVDEAMIRKTLKIRMVFMGGHHGKSPCCPNKNIAAHLKFVKEHMDVPVAQNILWTDETTVSLFGRNTQHYVWRKKGRAHQHQNPIPTVKYVDGSVMVWGCFSASGPAQPAIIDRKMNSQVYQEILQENVRLSVRELKLNRS